VADEQNENVFTTQAIDIIRDATDMDVRTSMVFKFGFEEGYERMHTGFLCDGQKWEEKR